jgi:ribosome-associated protein
MTNKAHSEQLANSIYQLLDEHKAVDIKKLDVTALTPFTDYMIICHGNSNRHASGLLNQVVSTLKKEGYQPKGIEGANKAEWILVDYGDVVLHIMQSDAREFYSLEKLWSITEEMLAGGEAAS